MNPHKLTDQEFRAMLDWYMCSDPWPVEPEEGSQKIITALLNSEAFVRGYDTWVGAYHALPRGATQ